MVCVRSLGYCLYREGNERKINTDAKLKSLIQPPASEGQVSETTLRRALQRFLEGRGLQFDWPFFYQYSLRDT